MRWVATCGFALVLIGSSAHACMTNRERSILDLWYADAVVIGSVTNYELITDDAGRDSHRQFTIDVSQTLKGHITEPLIVNWNNHVFRKPEVWTKQGPFLFGLKHVHGYSGEDLVRSRFILWPIDENTPVILQSGCTPHHIYQINTGWVKAVATLVVGFLFLLKWRVYRHGQNLPKVRLNEFVKPVKRWGERRR